MKAALSFRVPVCKWQHILISNPHPPLLAVPRPDPRRRQRAGERCSHLPEVLHAHPVTTLWPSHITLPSAHLPSPALGHLPDHAPASPIPAQVMCDVLDSEHVPHITNSRAKVSRVLSVC